MYITSAVLIAFTTGLTEIIKLALKLNKRFIPLISLVIGIGLAFLAPSDFDIKGTILFGVMIGLSAAGFFSSLKVVPYVAKTIFKRIPKSPEK